MRRNIYLLAAIACIASRPALSQPDNVEIKIIDVPAVGEQTVVSVGSIIHEYSKVFSFDAVIPEAEMRGGQWVVPITVPAGSTMFPVSTRVSLKACLPNGACGLDDDGDGTFDRMAKDDYSTALKLKVKVPYKLSRVEVERPDSLRQVVMYQGATTDSLRLSYREFQNNMARPAFTEDLTIPLGTSFPQDVAVKKIKLRVHSIDGLGMRYEILP